MKRAAIVLCLLVLSAAAIAPVAGCRSTKARAAAERGLAEAEKDIREGTPALLFIGLPDVESDGIDARTGLPHWSVGCVIDDESSAYVGAYNGRIEGALAGGELKGKTLEHKLTTWAAVDARFRTVQSVQLILRGDAVLAPGGRFRLAYRTYENSDHPNAVRFVYVTDTTTGREVRTKNFRADGLRALFDHDGTTLIVRDDEFARYLVLDLPRGIVVQYLPDPTRGG